ncbi:ABC transporter substrate-binding protein [Amycolatopsis jejuensis]|uniref:ABC transporter substrate-binding protein n=1 Tax=Amycolatopsis jejuensis TaxID=330084 RepID=UPI000AB0CCDB|nr:ABC transporter substrate-binding protein [Amycolatopsis jejuensis]
MKRFSSRKLLVLGVAVVLAAAGCSSGATPGASGGGGTADSVTIPFTPEPKSLNPDWQNDTGAWYPAGNIYSRLVDLDWGATAGIVAYPDLAKSWDTSPDGKTYTFHLREGVKWHDGKPLTSADVVYTYQTIQEKRYPLAQYLNGATITAPDPQTVVIAFAKPNVAFVPLLAQASNWYGAILPKHLYEGTDWTKNPANTQPVGTGPFKFVSWQRGGQVSLEANPDYFLGAPKVKKLNLVVVTNAQVAMAGFQSGQYPFVADNLLSNYQQIKQLESGGGDTTVVRTPSLYGRDVYFNLRNSILADLRVRQAISYGIDRDAINRTAFAGLWPPDYNAGISSFAEYLNKDAQFPHFDLAKAKQLLDESGHPAGPDGTRFTLRLTNYPSTDSTLIAQVLVEQFKAMGIAVKWQQFDLTTWLTKLGTGDFDLSTYYVRYGPDPAAYAEHFGTGGPRNFTKYSNQKVDALLAQAGSTTDVATRKQLYNEVQTQLVADVPYVNLFTENKFSLARKGWDGFAVQSSAFGKAMGWFSFYAVHRTS